MHIDDHIVSKLKTIAYPRSSDVVTVITFAMINHQIRPLVAETCDQVCAQLMEADHAHQ
jgi:hypothetical protein